MDYEEKYKEALESVRKLQENSNGMILKKWLWNIFPELKESEGEKIRKWLIGYFNQYIIDGMPQVFGNGLNVKDVVSWLEKQDNESVNIDIESMVSSYKQRLRNQAGIENSPFLNMCLTAFRRGIENTLEELNLKQGEQKSIDKVKPKFKVGDWISNDMCDVHIASIEDGMYYFDEGDGLSIVFVDEHYHIWTIEDAMDGDVLCCESGWTCIFKTLNSDNISFSSYCFMDNTGWFCETGSESHTLEKAFIKAYNGEIYPATKEQRDFLFQKMKEARYTFDFKNKELKKIKNDIEIPFGAKDSELQEATYFIPKNFHAEIDDDKVVIKKGEKPTAWSEEDETRLTNTIIMLKEGASHHFTNFSIVPCVNWLKSLKQRIGG